jgi:hypothetical protein
LIHLRQRDRAKGFGDQIQKSIASADSDPATQLTTLAVLGHYSSSVKNWSLVGPAIFFAIVGSGPYSLLHLWGVGSH